VGGAAGGGAGISGVTTGAAGAFAGAAGVTPAVGSAFGGGGKNSGPFWPQAVTPALAASTSASVQKP
jgi:hypothetical protein